MKKYYLHNGTESSGPFDIEELKAQKISTKTPVWFEGMERWSTAGEINELASLFIVNPPPIEPFSPKYSAPKMEKNTEERTILGLPKTTFLITFGVIILIGCSLYINNLEEKRSEELDIKNHKTEVENYQLELKQKELEEQKIQDVIQEKIDSERIAQQKKDSLTTKLSGVEKKMADYQTNLDATEEKLNNTSSFKLLRSDTEKKEQMTLLQKNIDSFKNEMGQLKEESNRLKLALEKIK